MNILFSDFVGPEDVIINVFEKPVGMMAGGGQAKIEEDQWPEIWQKMLDRKSVV